MYKKAGRVFQRLKAAKIVGKKARPPKAHGVTTLPLRAPLKPPVQK